MSLITSEQVRAKAAHAFGFDCPSVLDSMKRENFNSDEEFLDAATKAELERQSPEYREIRSRLERELNQRREREAKKAEAERYAAIRSTAKLNELDQKNIDARAQELAKRDLAANRINVSGLAAAIMQHAEKLTEECLNEKAASQMMNENIRQSLRGL